MTGFRTIIFNLVMAAIMIFIRKYDLGFEDKDIQPFVEAFVGFITIGGNLVLRWFTNTTMFKKTSPAPMPESTVASKAPIVSMVMISCLSLGLMSCATLGININSPQKKYLVVRTSFNDLMEQYIAQANKIPIERRLEVRKGIKAVDKALDTWERSVLDPEYDFSKDMAVWLEFKSMVIEVLAEVQK